ncbi:MAG: type II toxin-antitoxin system RelE/ParE family toxin [Polyangiaceae bacterium]|nr:type II toxin-antitoxin system RelE/ParE family toxin [Polyangiaceae bacterium]
MRQIKFHRAASAEAEEAVRWYNGRLRGLGEDFRLELGATVARIGEAPLLWPPSPYHQRTRACLLSRFPYAVVYMVGPEGSVTVVAVAHLRRRPGYWLRRVPQAR